MRLCPHCQRLKPDTHFYSRSGSSRCRQRLVWTLDRRYRVMTYLNLGLSDAAIGKKMGVSGEAIKLMRRRYGIEGVTKTKLTAREVARVMGVQCAKSVTRWIAARLLRGEHGYRQGPHRIWLVERVDLYGFVEDEGTWHVWDPARITDRDLRRYATRIRGGVRFLTPGEVADRMFVQHTTVNSWIHKGFLPARRWGNWWIDERDLARFELPRIGGHPRKTAA
jgi:hypothetical protein